MSITDIILSVCGTCFYTSLFIITRRTLLGLLTPKYRHHDVIDIACKSVSTVHAILTGTAGVIIVLYCSKEIKYTRHWLTNSFAWFSFPYFIYDIWCMYYVYKQRPDVKDEPFTKRVNGYLRNNKLIIIHHVVLSLLAFPVIVYLRGGLGDYVVGCVYMAELSTPFVALRAILSLLGKKNTLMYVVNGLLMMITFFFFRVCTFPLIYYKYMHYSDQSLLQVIKNIPVKCNIGSGLWTSLQLYWFCQMVFGAAQMIKKFQSRRQD